MIHNNDSNNININPKLVSECVNCIMDITERTQVTVSWTPAYTSVIGNLRVDALVKKEAHLAVSRPEIFVAIREKLRRTSCYRWVQESLNEWWRFTKTRSQTKQFIVLPSEKLTKQFLNLNKLKLSRNVIFVDWMERAHSTSYLIAHNLTTSDRLFLT